MRSTNIRSFKSENLKFRCSDRRTACAEAGPEAGLDDENLTRAIPLNDINARSSPTYGGHYGEFTVARKSGWQRVEVNGVAQIYPTEFEAETMAWRAARAAGFGLMRSTQQRPVNVKSEAEKLFGGVFHKGRQVPVEYA